MQVKLFSKNFPLFSFQLLKNPVAGAVALKTKDYAIFNTNSAVLPPFFFIAQLIKHSNILFANDNKNNATIWDLLIWTA